VLSQGSHNRAKIFDESAIERGQPIKVTTLCDVSWDRPTLDYFNLEFINLDSHFGGKIIKENNLRSKELTLSQV